MNITADQLHRAAQIKDQIESLESELSKILGGHEVGKGLVSGKRRGRPPGSGRKGRRKMGATARARIAAAARARWRRAKAAGRNRL